MSADSTDAGPAQGTAPVSGMLRDGLELGTTLERDVNRALRFDSYQPASPKAPHYDFAKYAQQYFGAALNPENLISSVAASATSAAFHAELHDFSAEEFQTHLAENLTRKGIAGSIDFVTASLLQQDLRFLPSGEHGMGNRIRYAFLQTFIARGRAGNELAVPRIAASLGTAWVLGTWHPWMVETHPWSHAGFIFGSYMARSFWMEFKPDVKHQIRTRLRRDRDATQP